MDATSFGPVVWGASAAVVAVLLLVVAILWRAVGAGKWWFWALLVLAAVLSGPVVRGLVNLWGSAPDLRIVPGLVATWTPAALVLGATVLLWRLRREGREAQH